MKIMTCCSKKFYNHIEPIKTMLEAAGHTVILPNCYDCPTIEEEIKEEQPDQHQAWKADMLNQQKEKVLSADAILVLNLPYGEIPGHIGGATFLEIYEAWLGGKKVFLLTPHVPAIMQDELNGLGAVCLDGDLAKVK